MMGDQAELIPRTKDDRIAELEAALRDLLERVDSYFCWEGEPNEVEERCRAVLENKLVFA